MTDLTKITSHFGLLDPDTQDALRAHGGPYEFFNSYSEWDELNEPGWVPNVIYRVKPQPPKPREIELYEDDLGNKATWYNGHGMPPLEQCRLTKWREVLE